MAYGKKNFNRHKMKIICIGRNYVDHIEELHNERPDAPVIFTKPDTALLKNNEPFYYPDFSSDVHYELELVVQMSKEGKAIHANYAHNYYSRIGLGVDFTARDLQTKAKEKGLPWALAKGFNGSAPVSDFIDLRDRHIQDLQFLLHKNGEVVQQGHTARMIWTVAELISYVSHFITLKIGDILFTGTPKGVGPVQIGDRLAGFLESEKLLDFEIK